MPTKPPQQPRRRLPLLALAAVALAAAACGTSGASKNTTNSSGHPHVNLSLVAYSTPKTVYSSLISAFEKTAAGKNISFTTSFAASGSQAKAVVAGLSADVVNFSLTPDMDKLVQAGLVSPSWDKIGPAKGMVTDSTVVFIVRKGNPLHIANWADLVKPGVKVVTPNPFSSGSARWNLMAAYGAELKLGKSPAQADSYLQQLLKNTVSQPGSASDALAAFQAGTGDVLLDYEDDALAAQRSGAPISIVVPPQSIEIQNPIAVVKTSKHPAQAQAFLKFLFSAKGQQIWLQNGYGPVLPSLAGKAASEITAPKTEFTIGYLGGWDKVISKFFDPSTGIVTRIESGLGVSTASS